MKALTLWQPWASMIALGAKRIETRSWTTAYRGPLAIHAAARAVPKDLTPACLFAAEKVLALAGLSRMSELPRGKVVATCKLVDVVPLFGPESERRAILEKHHKLLGISNGTLLLAIEREWALGNYEAGRFAWLLEDVVRLATPVPAKGAQGFWEWRQSA